MLEITITESEAGSLDDILRSWKSEYDAFHHGAHSEKRRDVSRILTAIGNAHATYRDSLPRNEG